MRLIAGMMLTLVSLKVLGPWGPLVVFLTLTLGGAIWIGFGTTPDEPASSKAERAERWREHKRVMEQIPPYKKACWGRYPEEDRRLYQETLDRIRADDARAVRKASAAATAAEAVGNSADRKSPPGLRSIVAESAVGHRRSPRQQ